MTLVTATFPPIVIPILLTIVLFLYYSYKMGDTRYIGADILSLLLIQLVWLVYFIIF